MSNAYSLMENSGPWKFQYILNEVRYLAFYLQVWFDNVLHSASDIAALLENLGVIFFYFCTVAKLESVKVSYQGSIPAGRGWSRSRYH